jgi:ATP-dependent Clp protease ATP-binding subunit ClpC
MFERFTDRARRIVVLAQEESRMLGHHHIGTEHILLGLIHERESVVGRALTALGLSLDEARQAVEGIIGRGAQPVSGSGHIPFTPRAKKVLELSLRESLQLGGSYIGPEHILLAVIREGGGVAVQVMDGAGVDLNQARQQVIELLHGPGLEDAPSFSASASSGYAPPAGDDLMSRLASFAARLNAIERRLRQSG